MGPNLRIIEIFEPEQSVVRILELEEVGSTKDLVSVVRRFGTCHLFRKKEPFRLYDAIRGGDSTVRRGKLLQWAEQAHLHRQIFLTVDRDGSMMAFSRRRFLELQRERSAMELSEDETKVLSALTQAMPTPALRKASDLPAKRFDKALTGLRYKMRVALVEVKAESKTKYVNVYDRTKPWPSSGRARSDSPRT
jgi:hypothetical protein